MSKAGTPQKNKVSKEAMRRYALEELARRQRREIWRKDPLKWVKDRLGEDPKNYEWSDFGGAYDTHVWDGDKNPLAYAWKHFADVYKSVKSTESGNTTLPTNIAIESGTGCHAKGQEVIMYDGSFKRVEDIMVGDKLMGDDSTPREVLRVISGEEPLYKIRPDRWREHWVVNESHILHLKPFDDTKAPLNITVKGYLKNIDRLRDTYAQARTGIDFSENYLSFDPYWVGRWYNDDITADDLIKVMKKSNELHYKKCFRCWLKNSFDADNGFKTIPLPYLTSSREHRLQLLSGIIDACGHFADAWGTYVIACVNPVLIEQVEYLARGLGLSCTRDDGGGLYRMYIIGNCKGLSTRIVKNKCNDKYMESSVLLSKFTIEPYKDKGSYYGFELDGNSLYLLKDTTITHNTGKTYFLARIVFWFLDCFENSLVVTSAPSETQLKLGLWSELSMLFPKIKQVRPKAEKFKLRLTMEGDSDNDETMSDHAMTQKDSWHAVGHIAGTKADEVSANKARGFHREHMLIILEECTGIPVSILTAFINTCTGNLNFILAVGNPNHEFDALHQLSLHKDCLSVRISALDHPNIVLNKSKIKGCVERSRIENRKNEYGEKSPLYEAMVRGISPTQGINSLIKVEWVEACMDTYNDDTIVSYNAVGVDVANSTLGDKACTCFGVGNTVVRIDEFPCANATHLAYNLIMDSDYLKESKYSDYKLPCVQDYAISPSNIGVDSVGIGVATVNAFVDMGYNVQSLEGGVWQESIPKEERWENGVMKYKPMYSFYNLRSQMYWQAREDLRQKHVNIRPPNTLIAKQLMKELCIPQFRINGSKIQVESKTDIKKRLGGKSPNVADAFVYWNWMRLGHRVQNKEFIGVFGGY